MTETTTVAVKSEAPIAVINDKRDITDTVLAKITSFEDAMAALNSAGIVVESSDEYGNGFQVVDKDLLVGVNFVILEWRFNEGSFGDRQFVSASCVTEDNRKVVINDGSSGVAAQLARITDSRRERKIANSQSGLVVKGGLIKSEYYYREETKEISRNPEGKGWTRAATYYLSE